jgi:hypothetical protein
MYIDINEARKISMSIYYNECKVRLGVAECVYAGNFLQDAADLSRVGKAERFSRQIALNRWVEINALHITINFAPVERFDREKLIAISQDYMEGIGFKDQPYLVYQHFDAGHPHLHIVTTNIRDNGDPINLHRLVLKKSEPTRKAIEEKYGLVKREQRKQQQPDLNRAQPPEVIQYGKRPTAEAITDVLNYVLHQYRYRDLIELNAILQLYNLRANPGKPGGRMHAHGGLQYRILDTKGKYVGTPMKTSAIYFNPGLKWLQEKFQANREIDPSMTMRLQGVIDQAVRQRPASWEDFTKSLQQEQVAAVPHLSAQGQLDGMNFVDLKTKGVIKASDLWKDHIGNALGQARDQNEVLEILFRKQGLDQALPNDLTQEANLRLNKGRSQSL